MYEYLIFDLDGTLTDPKEGITKSVQYALQKFGIQEDAEKLTPFIGPPLRDSFREFYGFSEEQAEKGVEFYRERFASGGLFENVPYEGMGELLQSLCAAGKRLGVATSKPEIFARQILERFQMADCFQEITGASVDGRLERKEDVLKEALRRFGITEEEKKRVLMIGDRRFDIQGARACGVACAAVTYGYADPGEFEETKPDYLVHTVKELGELLLA